MDYEEKTKALLQPYLEKLHYVVIEAWNTYNKDFAENAFKLFPLGRAIIMNNLVIGNMTKVFDGYNNIDIKKNGHGAILIIRSNEENFRLNIRFKKLDQKYRTLNAKTARNNRFVNQEPYLGEELLPQPLNLVNLNTGYRIDETWNAIEIWITCPNGATTIAWKFKISNEEIVQQVQEIRVVAPTATPIQTKKRTEATHSEFTEEQKSNEGTK